MKTIQFPVTGEPRDVLQCVDASVPQPKHGQVLVRMLASPVNPSDMMFIRGIYGVQPQLPATPGFEGVGIVEGSGGGLRGRLFKGKRVVVLNQSGGNWAEYAIAPADRVIPVSSHLSVEQAATFFVNPATAWVMTREVLKVPQGAWLLQTAAGSSLGRMVIRLGNHCGFRTVNVVRREAQAAELKAEGANQVVVFDPEHHKADDLRDSLRQIVGDQGVRYAIDPVGGATGSAVVRSLGPGGRMLVYGTLSPQPLQFGSRDLMTQAATIEGFWLSRYMAGIGLARKLRLFRRIERLIRDGILATTIGRTWSLEQVTEAVAASENSDVDGKQLLSISDA
ncbi:MAG: zinc-dependent alcohol dehydrogenase family protein [Planctomycetaceae bacterium]